MLGATASVIIMIILLGFGISKFNELVNRLNPNVLKSTFLRNLTLSEPYRPQDLGFDFSFGLDQDLDPSYGYFTAKAIELKLQKMNESDTSKTRTKTSSSLSFEKCGTDNFDFGN
jgi:hypothetical protein